MNRTDHPIARRFFLAIAAFVLIALANRGCTSTSPTTSKSTAESATPAQPSFPTPEDAVKALIAALRSHDDDAIAKILGPGGQDIVSSGDAVADENTQDKVLNAYDQKHELVTNSDGSVTLDVGDDAWPMPIPLVKNEDGKTWVFDTDAGKNEIINRRVGNNELNVIEVCKAICDAQKEYARLDPDHDGVPEYARKFISDTGKKNGLFWETAEGEPPSPLGPAVAQAQGEGYAMTPSETGEPRPFHGYFYRIITAQGPGAPDGAMDYVINGKLIGGFAVVAWPADYGNSGIMTFIANYTGDVYQKDLGDDTDKLARAIAAYDPAPDWKKAE